MSIKPSNYKILQPFQAWVQQTLPAIYDDSLSYTDLLAKMLHYVNTLAENNNTLSEDVTNAINYINTFFESTDFQDKVDDKLNRMASDGSLSELIQPLFDAYKVQIDSTVETQNTSISNIQSQQTVLKERMDTFTKLPSGSTSGDAELQDIRIGGNGVTYNTAGDAVRGQYSKLNEELTDIRMPVNDFHNNKPYSKAGDAVRGQINTLRGVCFNKLTNVVENNTDLNDFEVYGTSFLSSSYTYINAPTIAGLLLNYNLSTSANIRKLQVVYDFEQNSNKIYARRYNVVAKAWTNWEIMNKNHAEDAFNVNKVSDNQYKINCNGYTINFNHIIKTGTNSDLWNITSIKKGDNIVVPEGTDILGPIKETNAKDFSGGVHGNEHITNIYIDYNAISFNVIMNSTIYSTIDGSAIFDRAIQLSITNSEITIDSVFTAKKNCSVERCCNGGLIATYIKDTKAVCCANVFGSPTKSSNAIKENTTATFITNFGTIVCENIIGHELDSYKGFLIVYSNESVPRYKIYFDTIEGNKTVVAGEVIHGKFRYKLL